MLRIFQYLHKLRQLKTPQDYCERVKKDCNQTVEDSLRERIRQAGPLRDIGDVRFDYPFYTLPEYAQLRAQYRLDAVAGEGSTFTRALRVMDWLTAHTWYCGYAPYRSTKNRTSLDTLRYAYNRPFRRFINCAEKGILFADCLCALGIHAMPVWMLNEGYCHVLVQVWLEQENRWVVLDPSFNAYFTDTDGRALHLFDLHTRVRLGQAFTIAQYSFNGTQDCKAEYRQVFLQACMHLFCFWESNLHADRKRGLDSYVLAPQSLDLRAYVQEKASQKPLGAKMRRYYARVQAQIKPVGVADVLAAPRAFCAPPAKGAKNHGKTP